MSLMISEAYSDHRIYVFGDFTLDIDRASLCRAGKEISLRPKAFDVLRYLVDRQGKIVSREELHNAIWGATVVTDDAVTQCLIDIRKALADSSQSIVRTVPRRGYVFELPVTPPADSTRAPEPVPEARLVRKAGYVMWGTGLAAIAVLVLITFWILTTPDRSTGPDAEGPVDVASHPAIAVLPFAVLSDDSTQTYFADGISDEILTLLARQRGLKVIARTSSFSYRDRKVDIATVAEELGVSHVLEGSFRSDGAQIRVNVQLIDGANGEYLWNEKFDRALSASNVFAIQTEIAVAVSEALKIELPTSEYNQFTRIPTGNLVALDAYFEGRAKMETRHVAQLDEASALFERAIELDPDFALAHVALADVTLLRNIYGSLPVSAALRRIETAVNAAMKISDQTGEAYLPLGTLLWWRYGDLHGAERAYLQGIELSPNYAPLYQWYANLLSEALARPHDALPYAKMSVALDPRSAITIVEYANRLAVAGEFDQALQQLDRAIAVDPDMPSPYLSKAGILRFYKGDLAEALPIYEHAYRITPQSPLLMRAFADAVFDLGYFEQAEALIDDAISLAHGHGQALLAHAYMQIHRGDRVGAVDSARAALADAAALPGALAILRDHYMQEREHEKALEVYRRYYPLLFEESSQPIDLVGWEYPVAIDLSVLLIEMRRTELAEKLLGAALEEAERRRRLGIGPPDVALARIHALRGDTDAAIGALKSAIEDGWRAGWRLALYHDRALDSLRDLPEFQSIVERVEADIEQQRRDLEARHRLLTAR